MIKQSLLAGIILLFAACSNESEQNVQDNQALVPVCVHVSGFSMNQEEFPATRTAPQSPADYTGIKSLTLAFYDGTTEVYKTTQNKDDTSTYTTFGEFSLSLPLGSYTMVVLGYALYNDDELTLTSPTLAGFTVGSARETFSATQAVNITNTSAVELSATLNRIVAQLKIISTDNRTANVTNVRMTFSNGGKAFNPTTGLATSNTGFSNTVGISAAVGEKTGSISNIFLATDEQTMDVTIETLDADGNTLFNKTVTNVPFKRNRITKLSGAIYSNTDVSSLLLVNTGWLADHNDTF